MKLNLKIRRGPTTALANRVAAKAKADVNRADVFWAVDSRATDLATYAEQSTLLPSDLQGQLKRLSAP